MMIQNDDIDSALAKPLNGANCRGPAIDRQQQLDGKSPEAIFDAVLAQTVAFIQTVRQVMVHSPAERGQNFRQKRSRSDAVHVVISENDERLVLASRQEQPLDGRG